jgi:DNA topoisomerase-3
MKNNNDEGGGEAPTCECQLPASQLTVRREGPNQGRPFWSCSKGKDSGCGFFVSIQT